VPVWARSWRRLHWDANSAVAAKPGRDKAAADPRSSVAAAMAQEPDSTPAQSQRGIRGGGEIRGGGGGGSGRVRSWGEGHDGVWRAASTHARGRVRGQAGATRVWMLTLLS
jgi:hypothetical protein